MMGVLFRVDAFTPCQTSQEAPKRTAFQWWIPTLGENMTRHQEMTTVLHMHMPRHQKYLFILSKFSLSAIIILYKLSKTRLQKRHLWRTAKNPMWFFVNKKCLGGTKAVKMFNVRLHSQSRILGWILKEQFQSQNITLKSIAVLYKYNVLPSFCF